MTTVQIAEFADQSFRGTMLTLQQLIKIGIVYALDSARLEEDNLGGGLEGYLDQNATVTFFLFSWVCMLIGGLSMVYFYYKYLLPIPQHQ